MKDLLAVLGILFIALLWLIPIQMYQFYPPKTGENLWFLLWIPDVLLSFLWGLVLYEWYKGD